MFIGGGPELDELRRSTLNAIAGRGGLVLVSGEPGIGKTALARQAGEAAESLGAQLAWSPCWGGGGVPPFWPWVRLLRSLTSEHPVACTAHPKHSGLPAPVDLNSVLGGTTEASAESRFDLFDSVAVHLSTYAAQRPLVLVLDDIHDADPPSLALLQFLTGTLDQMPILVIATYREVEASRCPSRSSLIVELARRSTRVTLRGFTEAEIRQFIASASGAPPSEPLTAYVSSLTSGNPFFTHEVVRYLRAQGQLDGDLPVDGLRVPEAIRDTVLLRLSALSDDAIDVLRLASVIGSQFSLPLLASASQLPTERLLEILSQAVVWKIVQEPESPLEGFRFTHDYYRDTLYGDLTPVARARLHHRVATSLERLTAADQGPHLSELAHHFFASSGVGSPEKAWDYTTRAADAAMRALAYEQAARLYEQALSVLQLCEEPDDELCRSVMERLSEARDASHPHHEPDPTTSAHGHRAVTPTATFRREGSTWTVSYGRRTVQVADSKGMQYLAQLLAHPGREFHALALASPTEAPAEGPDPSLALASTHAGEVIDAAAARAYRDRLAELRETLHEAATFANQELAARAQGEIDEITSELSSAFGLGGRARTSADTAERARKAVTNRISFAMTKIDRAHPELAKHLQVSIRTGIFCAYSPERLPRWTL